MQGARPFWFHGFKGSFTPRISRCARFIAEPRINLRSRRRLCLLLFIPNLSSYPPLPTASVSSSTLSLFFFLLFFFFLSSFIGRDLGSVVLLLLLLLPKTLAGSARVSAPSLCVLSPSTVSSSLSFHPLFKLLTEDSIKTRL